MFLPNDLLCCWSWCWLSTELFWHWRWWRWQQHPQFDTSNFHSSKILLLSDVLQYNCRKVKSWFLAPSVALGVAVSDVFFISRANISILSSLSISFSISLQLQSSLPSQALAQDLKLLLSSSQSSSIQFRKTSCLYLFLAGYFHFYHSFPQWGKDFLLDVEGVHSVLPLPSLLLLMLSTIVFKHSNVLLVL